ncbi:MAG TPA: tetraacyldisaccharide 4'-kinase [Candidatus Binataceae bacterium]|nr:tetraacyldisaccharide 4'-kinase [Candidatus Binataceae bacterium]
MGREPTRRSGLEKLWQRDTSAIGALALLPLSVAGGIFRGAVATRNVWWRRMAQRAHLPVISVGNLTVGGNGKTPFALFLALRLRERGYKVAIISRGYSGAKSQARAALVADHGELKIPPEESGDEPAMMSRRFSGPIVVARRRMDGVELARNLGALDAVILDDGFQHTRLRRDLDFVLVSEERGFGNGHMLPAGPMREPLSAVGRADAIVIMSAGIGRPSAIRTSQLKKLSRLPVFHARVRPHGLVQVERGEWRETAPALGGRRVLAVSGLADPSAFHAMVREIDADLVAVLEYPDHHRYTSADWQAIAAAARDVDAIVTTEKDLIKLERFPFPRDSLYALRLEVSIADDETRALDELIFSRLQALSGTLSAAAQEVPRDAS